MLRNYICDDAKMYCAVKSNSDSVLLQNNLNKFLPEVKQTIYHSISINVK